ncbi:MAG TPA: peptidase M48 [Succinivibrionaceae bacterium]|nr:peptidase M48 [Succinivibrionaceae bacterium]
MFAKKILKLFSTVAISTSLMCAAAEDIVLPDIGTAGIRGLSIQREKQIGDYFMRKSRGTMAFVEDPVLGEYLRSIGGKLVMNAKDVRFPFEFFLVNNPTLNASAFLGGKVMVHTGLFHYCDTEDEFASVLAHEISHVTQRHLARYIEDMEQKAPLTTAGLIGSIAMAILNPMIGLASLSTTMGVSTQSSINFTRDNEYEADRIGIGVLARAGFNPEGMVQLFRKLMAMQGNVNPAFVMLMDHPLSETRVAEAQGRLAQYKARANSKNPDFLLAKARVEVRYMNTDLKQLKERLVANPDNLSATYRNYALALICYEQKQYGEALEYLGSLGSLQNNMFVIDLRTDIDLKTGRASSAAARLEGLYAKRPKNEAVTINLGNVYLESGNYKNGVKVLSKFTTAQPGNILAHSILSELYGRSGDRCNALQSKATVYFLKAQYQQATALYNQALGICRDKYSREIIKAKIVQTSEQKRFDEYLEKG